MDSENQQPVQNILPSGLDESFLSLLMANQRKIYGFILMIVPSRNDADDIMQETTIVMWRKYETYQMGTNFSAWGIQIARFLIMNYQRRRKDDMRRFSKDAYEKILEITNEIIDSNDDRMKALQGCVAKLNGNDSTLLDMRYSQNKTIQSIAKDMDRPIAGLYKVMTRIHGSLRDCVRKTLAAWEMP
ncbi:MAG: sigma-70 family RNA polymerase sigma factor [Phycisphaerae bacterium]|nr:sigma-70 family RNA polymerase sigma factor [Phycisphaerae bacterium]